MKSPSLLHHALAILLLPFMVTVIVPFVFMNVPFIFAVHPLSKLTGFLCLLMGFTGFISTVFLFNTIGKGTLAPWQPTQKMVIVGLYKYCRNPMIISVLFILIGESLVLNSIKIAVWAIAFLIINTTYFILKEEPDLHKRFGNDYDKYKKNVPRWLPRLTPYKLDNK